MCQELCESFDFWKLIPHEERIEIFYKFTNSSAQHEVEKMNTDMKLLEDKVEYLQFQAEYHQDQTKKISDLVYQKEIKQKMEIDGLNKQLKGQNLHDLENHNKDFGAQESDLKEQYLRKLGEKDQKIIELQSQIIGFLGKTKDVSDLKEKHLLSLQKKDQEIIGLQNRLIEIQENKDKPSNLNPANLTSQNKLKDKKITDLQKQLSAAKQKNSKSLDDMAKTIVDLKNQMAVVMKQEDGKDCNLLQIVHLQKDSLLSTEEVKTESFYLKEESLQNFEESESMNAEFENQHENLNMPPPKVITRRMSTRIIKPYQKRPSSYYY